MATEATDDRRADIRTILDQMKAEPEEAAPEVEAPEVEAKSEPEETAAEKKERTREEDGKFAKEPKQKLAPKVEIKPNLNKPKADVTQNGHAKDVVQAEIQEQPKPITKAPASWGVAAREEWAKVPPTIQAEIQRREAQLSTGLAQSTTERQQAAQWREVTAPYEMLLRQEGATAHQAVGNLLKTAATLRVGTPQQKAQLAADLIRSYGIDVEGVAAALDGKPAPQGQQQGNYQDPRVDQILQFMQSNQAQQQQRQQSEAQAEVDALAESMEFLDDVRGEMATFLEVAASNGRPMTAQEAYDRAIAFHPDIAKVVESRKAAETAKASAATLAKKKGIATSPKSAPGGVVGDDDDEEGHPADDRKRDIRRAIRSLSK